MTADVSVTVLGRLGWATQFARIDIRGQTATESILGFRTKPAAPPIIGPVTERSYPTTSVVEEILKLLPARPDFRASDFHSIHAAWEAMAVFAAAPHGVAATCAKSMLGWHAVPECVRSLQHSVGAEFVVITASPLGDVLRWWVSGDGGWVGIALNGDEVSMVPSSLADIRFDLLVDLVDAVTAGAA